MSFEPTAEDVHGNGLEVEVWHQRVSAQGLLGVMGLLILVLAGALAGLVWDVVSTQQAIVVEHKQINKTLRESVIELEYILTLNPNEAKELRRHLAVPPRWRQDPE